MVSTISSLLLMVVTSDNISVAICPRSLYRACILIAIDPCRSHKEGGMDDIYIYILEVLIPFLQLQTLDSQRSIDL